MRKPIKRPARQSRHTESKGTLIWIGSGALVLTVLCAVVWAAMATSGGTRFDEATLCDTKGPTAVTVVLIDATDSITAVQKAAIANRLERVVSQLSANERLAIYEIAPGRNLLEPTFSMCRPVSPDEVSELTGNKRVANERFEERFKPAVAEALASLLTRQSAEQSPIMEAVQAASVRSLQANDLRPSNDAAPKRLVVVSDMLQNGPAGSHYGGAPDFSIYRDSPQYDRFVSDLTGVDVVVLYLRRDDGAATQGRDHIDFWSRWFAAQGGTLSNAIPIEG